MSRSDFVIYHTIYCVRELISSSFSVTPNDSRRHIELENPHFCRRNPFLSTFWIEKPRSLKKCERILLINTIRRCMIMI